MSQEISSRLLATDAWIKS